MSGNSSRFIRSLLTPVACSALFHTRTLCAVIETGSVCGPNMNAAWRNTIPLGYTPCRCGSIDRRVRTELHLIGYHQQRQRSVVTSAVNNDLGPGAMSPKQHYTRAGQQGRRVTSPGSIGRDGRKGIRSREDEQSQSRLVADRAGRFDEDSRRRHYDERHEVPRRDQNATVWDSSSSRASTSSSETAQRWQLFPPGHLPHMHPRKPPGHKSRRQESETSPSSSPMTSVEQQNAELTAWQQERSDQPIRQRSPPRRESGSSMWRASSPHASEDARDSEHDVARSALAGNEFFAPDGNFEAMGLHPEVVAAIQRAGLSRPSRVQVCCHAS